MKIRILKHVLALALAAALILAPAGEYLAAQERQDSGLPVSPDGQAVIKSREEVIYAVAKPDGRIDSVYAVNHFTLAEAGKLTDYGNYTKVTNLTNTDPLVYVNNMVSGFVNEENFYYQGDMAETRLPWVFEIAYFLNGEKMRPQDLAGKSGKLDIHIKVRKDDDVDPVFYENYMLQISVALDAEKTREINAPDASLANAGKKKTVVFTVLPGKDADFSLSASVEDFAMECIEIAGMPFSMNVDLPETDGMLDEFDQLTDGIVRLNDGIGKLKSGIDQLKDGAESLENGSSDIKNGLAQLGGNSKGLLQASSQINSALAQVSSSLDSPSDQMDLSRLARLPKVLKQLADGLDQISGGLTELKEGFALAHGALAEAINELPDTMLNEDQIGALYMLVMSNDPGQLSVLDELVASYKAGIKAGMKVKGTYNYVREAFDEVEPSLEQVSENIDEISSALQDISDKMDEALTQMDMTRQLKQLMEGLTQLAENYEEFHKGLTGYMAGVDRLAAGYDEFHSGISSLDDGVGELQEGAARLHEGTQKLKDETAHIPERIEKEMDSLMKEYAGNDFELVSFTSPKNEKVDLVQFVIRCEGIEKGEETGSEEAESTRETLWDRLVNLFKGYFIFGS